MKRKTLKAYCRAKAEEFERMGYAHWKGQAYPVVLDDSIAGKNVYLELVLLEDEEEYLHIALSVFDDSWWNSVFTVDTSFIVRRSAS
jgi:hypothetical protein